MNQNNTDGQRTGTYSLTINFFYIECQKVRFIFKKKYSHGYFYKFFINHKVWFRGNITITVQVAF